MKKQNQTKIIEEPGSLLNLFSGRSLTAMAHSRVAWKKESMIPMIVLQNS